METQTTSKPRLLVLTDIGGDPDDQQSLVRLLVHSNEFQIEAIIPEHWCEHKQTPEEQMARVRRCLAAYGQVRDNLAQHTAGFPREADLQRITTPQATRLLPGKDETRHAGQLRVQHRRGLLPLLFEDLING